MSEKGLNSPVIRRVITVVVLLVVTSIFLVVYYFTYLPQEHASYNLRTFRILHEITQNFNSRVANYGTVYSNNYVSQTNKDNALQTKSVCLTDTDFNHIFLSSFKGNALSNDSFQSDNTIKNDSVYYHVYRKEMINDCFDTTVKKPLSEILEPCISTHFDVFESFLLIKQIADKSNSAHYDSILYESDKLNIANINTDSLFKDKNIESPAVSDLSIEGVTYKLYLLPFKMQSNPETFVLAGIVPYDSYRDQSQSIPVNLLLTLCFVLIFVLLALPFLKIFFLSTEESITINDIRAVITVVFVIPFFVTLICSGIWIWLYSAKCTQQTLSSLQYNVQLNFYKELREEIQQAKQYDSIINNPYMYAANKMYQLDTSYKRRCIDDSLQNETTDLKDIVFYPTYYKSLTSLHWMDSSGNDIAAWAFNKLPATYFKLADRDYFKEIKFGKGYTLPDALSFGVKDSFGLQPALSRLTGEYTINLAIKSNARFSPKNKTALVTGISTKMHSVYNTIVPRGFSYCIIDENGNILCHSDTARNLQENLFEECSDSFALRSIINHKDSAYNSGLDLYQKAVTMMVKPLPNLPFYLVTYYDNEGNYLFVFHTLAFVFLCESALLLFVSLFSYFMMLSGKKNSKLFYSNTTLTWLKPSVEKKNYYIKNSMQFTACIILVCLFSLFFRNDENYLYWLNVGLLLPLFAVTGYYIIKRSGTFFEKEPEDNFFTKKQFLKFLGSIRNILLLYFLSAFIFCILQNVLFFNAQCGSKTGLKTALLILIILMPLIVSVIAGLNPDRIFSYLKKHSTVYSNYLTQFIITLLLATTLISVLPTIIFTSYAFHEEKTLRLQSLQIDLAKKIQARRDKVNTKLWQTKLTTFKDGINYADALKFNKDKGIYLLNNNDRLDWPANFKDSSKINIDCSPFYKLITQYLFLPPEHDEFYDGATHSTYYYWISHTHNNSTQLSLHYANKTDNKETTAFSLTFLSDHAHLFSRLTKNYVGWLMLLILVILVIAFYKIIYSICVRVFLIGFFEEVNGMPGNKPDKKLELESRINPDFLMNIRNIIGNYETINFKLIRQIENEKINDDDDADGFIIELHFALQSVYENLWKDCNDVQKFTLYDFATDGFTNYKKVLILHQLFKAGLLVKEDDGNITLFTKSFRNFLITKETQPEIKRLSNQGKKGSWSTLRTIFYIILIAVAVFIFLSQEEASKRIITIITSLGAVIPIMLKLFDKSTTSAAPSAKSNG